MAIKVIRTSAQTPKTHRSRLRREMAFLIQLEHPRIVHRDLKPDNIIVESDGHLRILDLGLGRHMDGATRTALTRSGEVVGTLAWLSPDAWKDEAAGPPSDVYQLALIDPAMVSRKLHMADWDIRSLMAGSLYAKIADGAFLPRDLPPRRSTLSSRQGSHVTMPRSRPAELLRHHRPL